MKTFYNDKQQDYKEAQINCEPQSDTKYLQKQNDHIKT